MKNAECQLAEESGTSAQRRVEEESDAESGSEIESDSDNAMTD